MKNNDIWKNIDWGNRDEKRRFFNKYFNGKDREFVLEEISKSFQLKKDELINFMRETIREKDKSDRYPTRKETIDFINNLG